MLAFLLFEPFSARPAIHNKNRRKGIIMTTLTKPVENLREAFNDSDVELVTSCFGPTLTMLSGNYSGDPLAWDAHQFLVGAEIRQWAEMMITLAGPQIITQQEIKRAHERAGAALVITSETGSNKFREWHDELTAYWLGNIDGEWKIMGFFIRDSRNPE